jgi:hypothetical protein
MATMIKQALSLKKEFQVGDTVRWSTYSHDGRSYETTYYKGEVIKVHKINLIVKDQQANFWRVSKDEAEI